MRIKTIGLMMGWFGAFFPTAHAADWTYSWTPATGDVAPTVDVTPLKYGKTFAYAVDADGTTTSLLTPDTPAPGKAWGVWKLYDVVPNRPAVRASGVNLAPDPAFKQMQVWVVP